jgi:hypothetical protein
MALLPEGRRFRTRTLTGYLVNRVNISFDCICDLRIFLKMQNSGQPGFKNYDPRVTTQKWKWPIFDEPGSYGTQKVFQSERNFI